MKKSLLNTGLISFVVGFLIFVGHVNLANAEISHLESAQVLQRIDNTWNTLSQSEQSTKVSAYRQAVNAGMTHEQASGEANYVHDNLPDNGQAGNLLSSVQNTGWKYFENGNFILTKAPTFIPDVAEGDRTYQNIIGQLEDSSNQDVVWPLPLDADGNPDASMVDTGTATTTTPMLEITDARRIPVNTESGGTTDCGSEGLEGVDFLVFHGPLVPCGVKKTCADSSGKTGELSINEPCTLCHFIILAKNVFDLLLSMIIIVSLFMLTAAGVLYIVSSGGNMVSMAKGIIEKTLFGFGIFILGWLIVYTLLNMLSVDEKFIGKGTEDTWFQFECDTKSVFGENLPGETAPGRQPGGSADGEQPGGSANGEQPGGSVDEEIREPEPSPDPSATDAREQEQAYRNMLKQAGIEVNNSNHCSQAGAAGCTTIAGAKEYTVDKIMQLKLDDCPNCNIQVNGVTDKWIDSDGVAHINTLHSTGGEYSHDNGYKVDYDDTPSLNQHFVGVSNVGEIGSIPEGQTNGVLTRDGYRNSGQYSGPKFVDSDGNQYVYETQQGIWDVTYHKGG